MALTCDAAGCRDEFTKSYRMNLNFDTEWGVRVRKEQEFIWLCVHHAPPEDMIMRIEQEAMN